MVRVYDAETVLRNLLFDLDRMIRDRNDPEEILIVIRKKTVFLTRKHKNCKIRWW